MASIGDPSLAAAAAALLLLLLPKLIVSGDYFNISQFQINHHKSERNK